MKSKAAAAGMGDTKHEVAESEKTQLQLANAPSLEEIRLRAYAAWARGLNRKFRSRPSSSFPFPRLPALTCRRRK
jgi:hypothetical protein